MSCNFSICWTQPHPLRLTAPLSNRVNTQNDNNIKRFSFLRPKKGENKFHSDCIRTYFLKSFLLIFKLTLVPCISLPLSLHSPHNLDLSGLHLKSCINKTPWNVLNPPASSFLFHRIFGCCCFNGSNSPSLNTRSYQNMLFSSFYNLSL